MRMHLALMVVGSVIAACTRTAASNPAPAPTPSDMAAARQAPQPDQGTDTSRFGGGSGAAPRPRPYNRVITSEARSRRGLFAVHRVGDRLLFEIPRRELGKDQLAIGRYTRAPAPTGQLGGFGTYGGDRFVTRTLRWDRSGNRVILRTPSYTIVADTTSSVFRAVDNSNYAPIIAVLNVESFGRTALPSST